MSYKFFTNQYGNSLYNKFVGVFEYMKDIKYLKAVTGYFRASGYFAIRKHFPENLKVRIIAGINTDRFIALANKKGLLFNPNAKDIKETFMDKIKKDILNAKYDENIENGILQLIEDIAKKRIEIRAHNSKKLHSKFYIFLPADLNSHSSGLVIMGSSNLTQQGLGVKDAQYNYEMNVELRDFDDVEYADKEFEKLWKDTTEILPSDAPRLIKGTYLDVNPAPFELYVKFLIEFFGNNIEYDPNSVNDIPLNEFKKLKYQMDAVNQGYELLKKHNGFFLADVVGTGKTVIAAMLVKKFIQENGVKTKVLVVYPPTLESNWKSTFRDFGIFQKCDFISNGSLNKILEGKAFYEKKEKYDLVLVDEAHKFRNHKSQQFENLQIICKAGRENIGNIGGVEKKVVLISATPLNNNPEDIYNLISLFQDVRNSNLNVINLQRFFAPHIKKYKKLISEKLDETEKKDVLEQIRSIFNDIRDKVVKDITIRRTRTDLLNIESYKKDLEEQKIIFPTVTNPIASQYELPEELAKLFLDTANTIVNSNKINFFRYRAIAFLTQQANLDNNQELIYQRAESISTQLAGIIKTMLVKRLESSFHAFKISLNKITTSTEQMIEMYNRDTIFIVPDLDISKFLDKGMSDMEIEEEIHKIDDKKPNNRKFKQSDFKEGFIQGLEKDYKTLLDLNQRWQAIGDKKDPKWDMFLRLLRTEYFKKNKNEMGKLVVFTESIDTLNYLTNRLEKETLYKVLSITSENKNKQFDTIRENFDANYEGESKNDFDIILTTDVLAEGINLHRANVIVNYDTPWNPTKLIQRLGRINRIGTKAKYIYNYNFYPSQHGDNQLNLKWKSLVKLQSSHTTFGEDNKIYSIDEIIDQFDMFIEKEQEEIDLRTQYLEWLRNFKQENPEDFKKIEQMPLKIRCIRKATENQSSIAFVKNVEHKNIYLHSKGKSFTLPFEQAIKFFEAPKHEKAILPIPELHYQHINNIIEQFEQDIITPEMSGEKTEKLDAQTNSALTFLNDCIADKILSSKQAIEAGKNLLPFIKNGTYSNLTNEINKLSYKLRKKINQVADLEKEIIQLSKKYTSTVKQKTDKEIEPIKPEIIISETFI